MNTSIRNQNLNSYATKKLEELEIATPTVKQLETMKSLLTKTGIIVSELSFPPVLSDQEVACIHLAIQGKRTNEIAEELNITDSTVKTYKQRVREKLNCTTREQVIYECIRYNYVATKD